jgi:hypothetical protein
MPNGTAEHTHGGKSVSVGLSASGTAGDSHGRKSVVVGNPNFES